MRYKSYREHLDMTLMEAVSDRLVRLQKEKGFTSYKIQKEGGVPRSTVGKLVARKFSTVQLDTIYQIVSTMGITIREFFDDPVFDEVTD